ncbi:hypothetical protein MtrunA17_Chr4g0017391 [Medicago truncatula]|uniref:Transmembrane protein n=1 Tax=Medicago truncatula TaxID=3880 RepID=A0A396I2C4_MEDTR|nr:hypothetical protein MtrunA17_Chr4g0017391 [Medicago truncatula]
MLVVAGAGFCLLLMRFSNTWMLDDVACLSFYWFRGLSVESVFGLFVKVSICTWVFVWVFRIYTSHFSSV